jgi:hypothetical protein
MSTPPATEPLPLILNDASLKISTDDTTANLAELACTTSHIEIAPDTTVTTVDTMCGSTDYAGVTKWTLTCTLIQSFDTGATEDILSQAVEHGKPIAWEVVGYRSQPISATNPAWSGLCDPRPYAPINGDAGAVSEISMEWGIIGQPVKSITPPAAMSTTTTASAPATTPSA